MERDLVAGVRGKKGTWSVYFRSNGFNVQKSNLSTHYQS